MNQTLPSEPAAIPNGQLWAVGVANSMTTPEVVIRPIGRNYSVRSGSLKTSFAGQVNSERAQPMSSFIVLSGYRRQSRFPMMSG